MSHLTDEQFEDMLRDAAHVPEHVEHCPLCRARLDEKRAIGQRIRRAFASIRPDPGLAGRIRAGVADGGPPAAGADRRIRTFPWRVRRHPWSSLTAAAAILLLSVSIGFYVGTGSPAGAAQGELAGIHHANLNSLGQLVNDDDPGRLCEYLEHRVGHCPVMLRTGSGWDMCGCCVREFQGRPVSSYVVRGRNAPISVIAVPQSPAALGMTVTKGKTAAAREIWQARHGCCNIASVRRGEYSYCAVGQVTQEELAVVLESLPE